MRRRCAFAQKDGSSQYFTLRRWELFIAWYLVNYDGVAHCLGVAQVNRGYLPGRSTEVPRLITPGSSCLLFVTPAVYVFSLYFFWSHCCISVALLLLFCYWLPYSMLYDTSSPSSASSSFQSCHLVLPFLCCLLLLLLLVVLL